jgi:hypothetical protein
MGGFPAQQVDRLATTLDGQVQADGYAWWQMKAEDGVTGWAVNIPEWYERVEQ